MQLYNQNKVIFADIAQTHPNFLMTLISLRSTLVAVAGSMTVSTASTDRGASWLEY